MHDATSNVTVLLGPTASDNPILTKEKREKGSYVQRCGQEYNLHYGPFHKSTTMKLIYIAKDRKRDCKIEQSEYKSGGNTA